MPKVVGLERLRLELVQEADEFALGRLDDGRAVLPEGVFGVVAAARRIALVLVNVVTPQSRRKRLAEDLEPCALVDQAFEVRAITRP